MKTLETLDISEDDKYEIALRRAGKVERLFVVQILSPWKTCTVHVLDTDKENAIGQALCAMGLASYETTKEMQALIQTHAVHADLYIGGWGKTKF